MNRRDPGDLLQPRGEPADPSGGIASAEYFDGLVRLDAWGILPVVGVFKSCGVGEQGLKIETLTALGKGNENL
jgi:hypothetical protein